MVPEVGESMATDAIIWLVYLSQEGEVILLEDSVQQCHDLVGGLFVVVCTELGSGEVLVGFFSLSSHFAHDARSQEPKACI